MRLNWLRNIIIIVGFVWLIFIFENVIYLLDIQLYKIFDMASVFAALLVYSLGYMGLSKSEVFENRYLLNHINMLLQQMKICIKRKNMRNLAFNNLLQNWKSERYEWHTRLSQKISTISNLLSTKNLKLLLYLSTKNCIGEESVIIGYI